MTGDGEGEIGFQQLGLGSVLKQNQLAVPANQRDYAWTTKEVRSLFTDIAREIGEDRAYFVGTIVTIPRQNSVLEVVDGQQRLATTAILLSAIRDYLRPVESDIAQSIYDEFLKVFNRNTRSRVPRLQLNIDDNEFFRAKLAGDKVKQHRMSHELLKAAFEEAKSYVRKIVSTLDPKEHGNQLNRWIDFIETKAFVILLRVPNASNAYRMFETLRVRPGTS